MKYSVKIDGLKELDRALTQLPPNIAKRELGYALRAGSVVIQKEAKIRAPRGTDDPHPKYGRLVDNIRITRDRMIRTAAVSVVHTGSAFWARFVEFGTKTRNTVKRRKVRKMMTDGRTFFGLEVAPMPAHPFMRPAYDTAHARAVKAIAERLAKGIERQAKKLASRSGA